MTSATSLLTEDAFSSEVSDGFLSVQESEYVGADRFLKLVVANEPSTYGPDRRSVYLDVSIPETGADNEFRSNGHVVFPVLDRNDEGERYV